MAEASESLNDIDKLYEYGGRLNEATDKSENVKDYKGIIEAAGGSVKAKQLAAQLIPRFFKHFPTLYVQAIDQHFNLCEDEELGVRVQAIRGLPLFCKDTPEYLSKIVDVLGQLLPAGENVERDAVHKALMSLLRQDVKTSITVLFKHVGSAEEPGSDESIREKVLCFIRDKVFPLKAELLKPQEEMERHITDLVKKSLQDVTGAEFKMFMDFLRSMSLFGQAAPAERIQELVEIIEGQADLDAQFDVSDGDHIDRLLSSLYIALPLFKRGASSSKFINYLIKHIIPVFDMFPEERKGDLLKNLAECSHHVAPQECRQLLPSAVQLLKVQNSLSYAVRTGRLSDSHGREVSIGNTVFVTTSRSMEGNKNFSSTKETSNYSEENILGAKGWPIQLLMGFDLGDNVITQNSRVLNIIRNGSSSPIFMNKKKANCH